jgi:hypothetical protein
VVVHEQVVHPRLDENFGRIRSIRLEGDGKSNR